MVTPFHSMKHQGATQWIVILVAVLSLLACKTSTPEAPTTSESTETPLFAHIPQMTLTVLRVIDDDFPEISDQDLKEILNTARSMYQDKFQIDNIRFQDAGVQSIETFFQQTLSANPERLHEIEAKRFHPGGQNNFSAKRDIILAFLKNWQIEQLQAFFPEEERSQYDSYDKLFDGISRQMTSKIDYIQSLQHNGQSILRKEKQRVRSLLNWMVALETQTEYDLVLTNTFILFDNMEQPFPHSIFTTNKVGGLSHKNEHRPTLGKRVIMGSTFGMDTDIPFFKENPKETVSRSQRNHIVGAYIIAHELGHAIFKLPDFYDLPTHCLMNNNKDITYSQGYDLLVSHSGPCPDYAPWMQARSAAYDGDWHASRKEWKQAISAYTKVLRLTPKNVDGHYGKWLAEISYKMSKGYDSLGENELAIKGAQAAVRLYKWEPAYREWLDLLQKRAPAKTDMEANGEQP